MTSIELTTSQLHNLINPVLPHTGDGKGLPALGAIRLEVRGSVLYAVATDRYTMGVTRHPLAEPTPDTTIAIGRADADAMLRLFKHGKTDDPELRLTIGNVAAETVLDPADKPALTVTAKDGKTLVLHGREDALSTWRTLMAKFVHRAPKPATPALALTAMYLPRWTRALNKSDKLEMFLGTKDNDAIVVRAGDHFIGVWAACSRRDGEYTLLADSAWGKELPYEAEPPAKTPAKASPRPTPEAGAAA